MRQYIGFKLNDNEFTIPILRVREIIKTPPLVTKLPKAPHYMRGIINLRDTIVPIVDLKELIDMGRADINASKTIVITSGNLLFGILVDAITSVINIDESTIEPPESFMQDNLERVEGVARVDDRLVILLDTNKLVDMHDMSMFEEDMLDEGRKNEAIPHDTPPGVGAPGGSALGPGLNEVKDVLSHKYPDDDLRGKLAGKIVELIDALASHEYERADGMIIEMLQASEGSLFREVGMVTRKLHNSLKEFKNALDPRIKQIADEDVPHAVDGLEYVISKTEDAANKTLAIVEKHQKGLEKLSEITDKITSPRKAVEHLREFSDSLGKDLTEILLAQDFQDLTGQIIRRVIELVNTIEAELVGLIATFGVKPSYQKASVKLSQKISQNGVDDLLKEFGF